jgi:hypothetical protein
VIALLLLVACGREEVCFGDCDTDAEPAPTLEGVWSGTISARFTFGWGDEWPCTGPASGHIGADLVFDGEATCGQGEEATSGTLIGTVDGVLFTATWTPQLWDQYPQFEMVGGASFEAIEATFSDENWNVDDGVLSLAPDATAN